MDLTKQHGRVVAFSFLFWHTISTRARSLDCLNLLQNKTGALDQIRDTEKRARGKNLS